MCHSSNMKNCIAPEHCKLTSIEYGWESVEFGKYCVYVQNNHSLCPTAEMMLSGLKNDRDHFLPPEIPGSH